MAILKDSDLFPFDEYTARLQALAATTEAFAASTVNSFSRAKQTYEDAFGEIVSLTGAIKDLSTQDLGKATAQFKAYEDQIDRAATSLRTARQTQTDYTEAQRANAQLIADLTAKLSSLQQRYQGLDPAQKDYAKQQRAILAEVKNVSKAIDSQSSTLKSAKSSIDAVEGSYQHLSKQTNELRSQLRNLDGAFDSNTGKINKNNAVAAELLTQIQKNDRALKAADATMGQHTRSVGNYANALQGLATGGLPGFLSSIGPVGIALGVVTAGLTKFVSTASDMERLNNMLLATSRDTDAFSKSQQFLIKTSKELGFEYETLATAYAKLNASTRDTAAEGKITQDVFHGFTVAGAALHLTNDKIAESLYAVQQMFDKTTVQSQELKLQLANSMPGAVKIFADAMGVSTKRLGEMMEKGELLAIDVLPKVAAALEKTYGEAAKKNADQLVGSWANVNTEAQLLVKTLNDDAHVTGFFASLNKRLSETMTNVRLAVKDKAWVELAGMVMGIGLDPGNVAARQQKENSVSEFRGMNPGMRKARLDILKDESDNAMDEFKFLGGGKKAKERWDKAASELRLLRGENLKLEVADIKDSRRAAAVAEKTEIDKNQTDLTRFQKQAVRKRTAEIIALEKQLEARPNDEVLAHKIDKYRELDTAQKAKDKEVTDRLKSEKGTTESQRSKALSDALSKSKAGTDVKLADLGADKQDGLISEQTFIDTRKAITLAGIAERQTLLANAHKQETDDYKRLAKEKIDAETQYKRDSLKLALSDSKSTTAGALSGLATGKADGSVSEADYVEQKLQITIGGLRDQQRILADAGQSESKLYRDTEQQILDETATYYRDRLKVQQTAWKTELEQTKTALDAVDTTLGESYRADLLALDTYYNEKERKLQVDTAKGKLTPEEGEAKLYAVKMERLTAEMSLTESTYQKDISLSRAVFDQKIADLNAYKTDAIRTPQELAEAEKQLIKLKQAREKEAADDKKKLDNEVARNGKEKSDEQTKHEIDNAKKAVEERQQLWQAGLQLAGDIGSALFSIGDSQRQAETDRLDKQHEHELQLAGDNVAAKTRIDAQYNKRKAELAHKAAIAEREAALFSIAINTAQAVMSVLSTGGGAHYLDFGVSAGILSAFVTASGIAQAAAVLSKPLPAYAKGKLETDTYMGPALAGEAGRELLVDREGYGQLFDKPTVFQTKPGDRVYTADETAAILQETCSYGQTATRLREGRFNEQAAIYQIAMQGNSGLTEQGAARAFASALDNRPADVTIYDAEGVKRGRKEAQSYTEYVEKRTKW